MAEFTFIDALKYLLLLLLPGLFWLYFFAGNKDIFRRPGKALLPVFVMGIFVCVPAFAIEVFCVILSKLIENKATAFITSFLIVAPLEEYLKSLAVDIGGYSRDEQAKTPQVLAWYFSAAIGFASIENVLYCIAAGYQVYFYRILVTTLAHVACSGVLAYFMLWMGGRGGTSYFVGFSVAMLLHGGYDYSINVHPLALWFWVPFFIAVVCYLETRLSYEEVEEDEEMEERDGEEDDERSSDEDR